MKEVEYNYIGGHLNEVLESLNRTIGQYKRGHRTIKIGITGRDPQIRFNEHLKKRQWSRMVVIYSTSSENYVRTLEKWLVDEHWDDVYNDTGGGGGKITKPGNFYLYLLLYK